MDARAFKRSGRRPCSLHLRAVAARRLGQRPLPCDGHAVRDRLVHRWLATQRTYDERDVKRVYYLSSEFLTGRSLGLCLLNTGLYEAAQAMAAERGFELGQVLDQEGDPGLGNGGLGRLAACFMDSLATLALPAVGYGIRYDFGIFEQRIENGCQVERHDNWLVAGNPWELPRHRGRADGALRRNRRGAHSTPTGAFASTGGRPARSSGSLTILHRRSQDRHREHAAALGRARDARVRPQVLQRRKLPAGRRGEDRLGEHLQGPLPGRPHRGRKEPAPQAAVLLRRLFDRGHRPRLSPAPRGVRSLARTASPSSSTTRIRRSRSRS